MKLRYQMRGLGLGIMVTALLMGVASDNKIPLSDAEIKMRALELGMVESDSLKLSDIPKIAVGSSGEEDSPSSGAEGTMSEEGGGVTEPGESPENADDAAGGGTASGDESGAGGESASGDESGAAGGETESGNGSGASGGGTASGNGSAAGESASGNGSGIAGGETSQRNEGDASDDLVSVVIEGGATSYSVCQQLEQLGLVEDAAGFDEYLCGMGYSRSVLEGTFYIAPGTSQEEIARIITGKR